MDIISNQMAQLIKWRSVTQNDITIGIFFIFKNFLSDDMPWFQWKKNINFDGYINMEKDALLVDCSSYLCTTTSCFNYNSEGLNRATIALAHSSPRGSDVFWHMVNIT